MMILDADAVHSALSYPDAIVALTTALDEALRQPGHTPPRQIVDTTAGQILLMPSERGPFAGVKVVTIAPDNPARGLPRINGLYVLFDAATLVPVAQLDAAELTAVRTAAVSALAVDRLARPDAARLVLFGTGPQARSHLAALVAVRPLAAVTVIARDAARGAALVRTAQGLGLAAEAHPPAEAAGAVAGADLIACCTTAREPLFADDRLHPEVTVVAVGSHEPDARELDAALVRRATLVVESRASAATAGDIVLSGRSTVDGELLDLVRGRVSPVGARVFKSVGEAWEDLAIAAAIYSRLTASSDSQAR
jgi:ornithine cyclodeaminase/alanine dehydrogenase-like protein (mu-crystallin family)